MVNKNVIVISRDGKHKGHLTGGKRPCRLEGCRGVCLGVRWDDGKLTYLCSYDMDYDEKTLSYKII